MMTMIESAFAFRPEFAAFEDEIGNLHILRFWPPLILHQCGITLSSTVFQDDYQAFFCHSIVHLTHLISSYKTDSVFVKQSLKPPIGILPIDIAIGTHGFSLFNGGHRHGTQASALLRANGIPRMLGNFICAGGKSRLAHQS